MAFGAGCCFNPYRVFEYVATLKYPMQVNYLNKLFQSLSGFRVRCNPIDSSQRSCAIEVSIPIGFSSTLQQGALRGSQTVEREVSIPIGFSSTLQLSQRLESTVAAYYVSIPIGFSSTLQHRPSRGVLGICNRFQSLSGFRVRCNLLCYHLLESVITVSIPIGFSSTLQLLYTISSIGTFDGFNPYRVFEYVATAIRGYALVTGVGFNPYRVFEYVATSHP